MQNNNFLIGFYTMVHLVRSEWVSPIIISNTINLDRLLKNIQPKNWNW